MKITCHLRATVGLFIIQLALNVHAFTIMSVSNFEDCKDSGLEDGLVCSKKTTVAIALDTVELDGTAEIQFVGPETSKDELANPITVRIDKPRPTVQYRTTYRKSVLNYPYEVEPILFESGWGKEQCEQADGYRVCPGPAGAAGICCNCSVYPNQFLTRPGFQCGTSRFGSAAHCTQSDELYYYVYQVHESYIYYTVDVSITYMNMDTGKEVIDMLTLGTDRLGNVIEDPSNGSYGEFSARITDHGSNNNPPLQAYFLAITQATGENQDHVQVRAGPNRYMLLSQDGFDLTGESCNKIGANHATFSKNAKCIGERTHSCYNNQLYHYFKRDDYNLSVGAPLEFAVSRKIPSLGSFINHGLVGDEDDETKYAALKFNQTSSHTPTMVMKIKADLLRSVVKTSPGKLVKAVVNPFEAQNGKGKLEISVLNQGANPSDFYIGFGERSPEVLDTLSSEKLAIPGGKEVSHEWTVEVTYIEKHTYFIDVILQDATFREIQRERIEFEVYGTIIIIDPGAGNRPDPPDVGDKGDEKDGGSFLDKIMNNIKKIGAIAGSVLGGIAALLVVGKLLTLCGPFQGMSIFGALGSCIGKCVLCPFKRSDGGKKNSAYKSQQRVNTPSSRRSRIDSSSSIESDIDANEKRTFASRKKHHQQAVSATRSAQRAWLHSASHTEEEEELELEEINGLYQSRNVISIRKTQPRPIRTGFETTFPTKPLSLPPARGYRAIAQHPSSAAPNASTMTELALPPYCREPPPLPASPPGPHQFISNLPSIQIVPTRVVPGPAGYAPTRPRGQNHPMHRAHAITSEELAACIKMGRPLYVNIENVDTSVWRGIMVSPGRQFSLIGYINLHDLSELTGDASQAGTPGFAFRIREFTYQVVHHMLNHHVPLASPVELDPQQLVLIFTLSHALAACSLSPQHPVLNSAL